MSSNCSFAPTGPSLNLPHQAFDGVFANASLFHVPSQKMSSVLAALHTTLREQGVLFISNPRGDGEGWSRQRYGHYMQIDTSEQFLEHAGFEILDFYYRPEGKPLHEQPWLAITARKLCEKKPPS